MRKNRGGWIVAVLLLLAGAPAGAEDAFEWRGSGGWGAGLPYSRLYEAGREQTVRGEVAGLSRLVPEVGMADGLQLLLRGQGEAVIVHLGPAWYLERQDFPLERGDAVEVVGAALPVAGQRVLMAREVRKTDKVLVLRDAGGFPLWSAWRRL